MSSAQDNTHDLFHFKNPFKNLFMKKTRELSPKLHSLLNKFEVSLRESIGELITKNEKEIISLWWMKQAMESLSESHKSVMTFMTDLEPSESDNWDDKWTDLYSDISLNLLQLCNAFSSEISRLEFALIKLKTNDLKHQQQQNLVFKNVEIDKICAILSSLVESMNLLKMKKSSDKRKVFLRALYGVIVKTLYIFGVFASVISGSPKKLIYITLPETLEFPWTQAFTEMKNKINLEIKNKFLSGRLTVLNDLEGVETAVVQKGVNLVSKEIDSFFRIVISGRCKLVQTELGDLQQKGLGKKYKVKMIRDKQDRLTLIITRQD